MTSRDFCYWLQGWFELTHPGTPGAVNVPTVEQVLAIKQHLAMVFKHEIDPSFGGEKVQEELSKIHKGGGLDGFRLNC